MDISSDYESVVCVGESKFLMLGDVTLQDEMDRSVDRGSNTSDEHTEDTEIEHVTFQADDMDISSDYESVVCVGESEFLELGEVTLQDEIDRSVEQGSNTSDEHTEDTEIEQVMFQDKCEFLNAIHDPFLEVVEPVDSRLMDELRQSHAISSDEENRVTHEHTRRDRARRTWMTLKQMPPGRFHQRCLPVLKNLYPHVLCGRDFCPGEEGGAGEGEGEGCVRCGLKERMLVSRFGDLFPSGDGCSLEEYSILVESGDLEARWELAFSLCGRAVNRDNAKFLHKLRLILQKIEVTVPGNLAELLAQEVPCACRRPRLPAHKPPVKQNQRVKSKPGRKRAGISSGYPSTMDDMNEEVTSVSISSHDTRDSAVEETYDELSMEFETQQSKDNFDLHIQEIIVATDNAASIRPLHRKLDSIKEKLSIWNATVKNEATPKQNGNGTTQYFKTPEENFQVISPKANRVRRLRNNRRHIYEILRKSALETGNLMKNRHRFAQKQSKKFERMVSFDNLPDRPKQVFLRLRHRLRSELQDNQTFVDSLERNMREMNIPFASSKQDDIMIGRDGLVEIVDHTYVPFKMMERTLPGRDQQVHHSVEHVERYRCRRR